MPVCSVFGVKRQCILSIKYIYIYFFFLSFSFSFYVCWSFSPCFSALSPACSFLEAGFHQEVQVGITHRPSIWLCSTSCMRGAIKEQRGWNSTQVIFVLPAPNSHVSIAKIYTRYYYLATSAKGFSTIYRIVSPSFLSWAELQWLSRSNLVSLLFCCLFFQSAERLFHFRSQS